MKAEELMIGDWVNFNTDITLFPYQIKELHHNFAMLGDNHPNVAWKRVMYDDFLPIPLTPEILEKNGFVKHSDKAFRYLNEDTRIGIDFYLGCGVIDITKNWYLEDEITFTLPVPYWVSDYQHALRLCGLTELADKIRVE